MFVKPFFKLLKDCVFPTFCLGCGKEEQILCDECRLDIKISGVFFCPVCHEDTKQGDCCEGCLAKSFLKKHVALCPYNDHILIDKLIKNLKYNYVEETVEVLEKMMKSFFVSSSDLFADIDFIAPVPLHPRRYVERGFNQSELLAEGLAKILNKGNADVLRRSRYTKQQAKLSKIERMDNVKNAFVLNNKNVQLIRGKRVLLVDDVFTTGSTMQEAAAALKNAGAASVSGFTIARG